MPHIVTLMSDFGTHDGYVGQMKGVILNIDPSAVLVDVTHDIEPFAVLEGALVLKGISKYFGHETIHLAVVDPGVGSTRRGIVARIDGRLYVGPDNGLFSLVLASARSAEVREIRNTEMTVPNPHPTFHGRDLFAPVAGHLSAGARFESVGPPVSDPVTLSIDPPRVVENGLDGEVIHVDRFGNLTTNMDAEMLTRPVRRIEMGDVSIPGLSMFFGQVPEGEPLALINSFGFLEIAVNRGNAAKSLGVGKGSRLLVRFGS